MLVFSSEGTHGKPDGETVLVLIGWGGTRGRCAGHERRNHLARTDRRTTPGRWSVMGLP